MRFRRALDRRNVTEALSAAGELQFVGLAEALELTLLLADGELAKYERATLRWHARFAYETKNVDLRESLAVLALARCDSGESAGRYCPRRAPGPATLLRANRGSACPLGPDVERVSQPSEGLTT
jgi:hypothetical protein